VADSLNFIMRPAARADATELARLRCESLCELGLLPAGDARSFVRSAAREFSAALGAERLAAWLLVAEGRVVGSACALFWERLPYAESSLHAELAGVYVAAAFRKRGFARALCREAIAEARARGARRIFVHPSHAGRRLYRELGFTDDHQMRL